MSEPLDPLFLQTENRALKDRIVQLESQNEHLMKQVLATEVEEEMLVNRLVKRLDELRDERGRLLQQVEQEEEFLTNKLQKKLEVLRQEKINLENELEQEEEFISNTLQKHLQHTIKEKTELEAKVSMLESKVLSLGCDLEKNKQDYERLKKEAKALDRDNFTLNRQLEVREEGLVELKSENVRMELDRECQQERSFLSSKRLAEISKRSRSSSLPDTGGVPCRRPIPHTSPSSSPRKSLPSIFSPADQIGKLDVYHKHISFATVSGLAEADCTLSSSGILTIRAEENPLITLNLDEVKGLEEVATEPLHQLEIHTAKEKFVLVFPSSAERSDGKVAIKDLCPGL